MEAYYRDIQAKKRHLELVKASKNAFQAGIMETGLTLGSWKVVWGNLLFAQKEAFLHGALVL